MSRLSFASLVAAAVWLTVTSAGCVKDSGQDPERRPPESQVAPTGSNAPITEQNPSKESDSPDADTAANSLESITTEEELRAALKAVNPKFDGQVGVRQEAVGITVVELHDPSIEDIGPLARLPLQMLDLSDCHVTDISPLEGKELVILYLDNTGVEDISVLRGMPLGDFQASRTNIEDIGPLEGAPLEQLNLIGTNVSDLSPLANSRIQMLWLTDTPVHDISPLASVPLVSLTLAGTKVSDLSPLEKHPLQRLHIAQTEVTDLSPLQWMKLQRLVFTPRRIKTGIEYARNMPSIQQIGTSFDGQQVPPPPSVFWPRYDAGEFD